MQGNKGLIMIYKTVDFVDTSQILNSYVIHRENDNSPLVFEPTFAQIKREKAKTEPSYYQYQTNWRNDFGLFIEKIVRDLFGDFLVEWETSLLHLKGFIEDEINPALEKPSSHSIFTAAFYLFVVYQLQSDSQPELAVSGDGGIYLEWKLGDKFVSIQIDREKSNNDRIYVEQGGNYGSRKLTENTLKEIFGK
jgi:hypothetical protein